MIYRTEAVVTGGGPAGICAALALARQGRQTVLVTNRPVLGGNSSSEIRVWTRGAVGGGNLYAEEMGIWGELKLRNLFLNAEANPVFWDDVLLEQVLEEQNLEVFFNTHVSGLQRAENGRICSVTGHQMGTEKIIKFEGDFFIDATGDGTLGALAGIPSAMGKESSGQYGESLAPPEAEKTTFGNTIFFFTKREQQPVTYRAPSFAYPIERIEGMLGKGGRIVSENMNGCDYWWFEMGGMKNTIADAQEIAVELKRLVCGVWNYIKNSGKFDAEYLTLEWEGNLPGKRESRRMIAEKILCQHDIMESEGFSDAAFYGGWYLDFHPSSGVNVEEDNCTQIPVMIYPVPLRCLYNRRVPNLVFAGRNIGVSHVAFASTRIMNTCALSGQAAGTLAAHCLADKSVPQKLSRTQVWQIQQRLLNDDMLIPGISLEEKENLASEAEIFVSSEEMVREEGHTGHWSLKNGGFLVYPARAGRTEFKVHAERRTRLVYSLYGSKLPSRAVYGETLGKGTLELAEGTQWISFPEVPAKAGFVSALLERNADVGVLTGETEYPGFLLGHRDQAQAYYPVVQAQGSIYGKENLANGQTRLWEAPNLWVSGREKCPRVELRWKRPVVVREILVFFNPDLNKELVSSRAKQWDAHHKYLARTAMPPQLVKSARLLGKLEDGNWQTLASLEENWKRRWRVVLQETARLSEMRLEILATYGERRAEVFEIRIFE